MNSSDREEFLELKPCWDAIQQKLPPALCRQQVGVDGHSGYGVNVEGGEIVDLLLGADASGYDELALGQGAQAGGDFNGEALHETFAVDVGVEEGCGIGFQ
jgi:hypothetical protein